MGDHEMSQFRDMLQHRLQDIIMTEKHIDIRDVLEDFKPCPDTTDMATSESYRDIVLLLKERNMRHAFEIYAALERIENGTYGICEECGEDIGAARLRAQPMATLCVHCQSYLERSMQTGGY